MSPHSLVLHQSKTMPCSPAPAAISPSCLRQRNHHLVTTAVSCRRHPVSFGLPAPWSSLSLASSSTAANAGYPGQARATLLPATLFPASPCGLRTTATPFTSQGGLLGRGAATPLPPRRRTRTPRAASVFGDSSWDSSFGLPPRLTFSLLLQHACHSRVGWEQVICPLALRCGVPQSSLPIVGVYMNLFLLLLWAVCLTFDLLDLAQFQEECYQKCREKTKIFVDETRDMMLSMGIEPDDQWMTLDN